jgi:hypothetical protein
MEATIMDKEKKFQDAEKMLREAGYNISKGLGVNLSLLEADCGTQCTGGCQSGCYTCATGTANVPPKSIHPTFQFPKEGILEELVTISEGTKK